MTKQIVSEARSWIGTKWKHQGRDRDGVDCAGLVVKVAHSLGISTFDTTEYLRHAKDETMLALCAEHMNKVLVPAPGDVVVLKYDNARHMGLIADHPSGGLSLIHAYSRAPRKVIEHRFDSQWLKTERAVWLGTFRFKGIE